MGGLSKRSCADYELYIVREQECVKGEGQSGQLALVRFAELLQLMEVKEKVKPPDKQGEVVDGRTIA